MLLPLLCRKRDRQPLGGELLWLCRHGQYEDQTEAAHRNQGQSLPEFQTLGSVTSAIWVMHKIKHVFKIIEHWDQTHPHPHPHPLPQK